MAIDIARLGGWNGQTIGLAVFHHHRHFSGDDHFLPSIGFLEQSLDLGGCGVGALVE